MTEEVNAFERAIDAACKSKYIMIDKRVSDILKSIAASEDILNLTKSVMIGFDFGRELSVATSVEGHFAMPHDSKRTIALVFCLLSAIDDKKIDVSQLLAHSFGGEDPYQKFCNEVLLLFRDAVVSCISGSAEEISSFQKSHLSDSLSARAVYLAGELDDHIKPKGKRILECFIHSLKIQDEIFMITLYDLLIPCVKHSGKTILKEIDAIMQLVKE